MIRYILESKREVSKFNKILGLIPEGEVCVLGDGFKTSDVDILVSIGYCSGYKISVGSLVEPSYVADVRSMEIVGVNSLFPIERRVCYSSEVFMDKPIVETPALYDCRLFDIALMPHKKLYAIRIVSDWLSKEGRNNYNKEEPWIRVAGLLREYLRE